MADMEPIDEDGAFSEISAENTEPVINIVLNPNDPQNANALSGPVPLFIRKLWKIVNDESNEKIISWNKNGDGFILHDQVQFISKTLPRYFKHNQLSSFVRQLNLYDFHKIQHLDFEKDGFQFSHPFFLRDVPQLLPLIKRKQQTGRQRTTTETASNSEQSSEVQELMAAIKDIKNKSDVIANEMTKLSQENAALWSEMNSLRVKYSKQTKIINKLIHFLIAYMQKHHNQRKSGRTVSTNNSNKYLKTGPKIMELDYRYKNNPHEFWTDFDNQLELPDNGEQEAYTVLEPAESNNGAENDNQAQDIETSPPTMRVSSSIEEILPGNQVGGPSAAPQFDYATSLPSSSKTSHSALQRSSGSQENVGFLIDNSRVEMNTIKELLKNLTPEDMSTFYKLVNENYKIQEDDLSVETENELTSLGLISPQEYEISIPEDVNVAEPTTSISILDDIIKEQIDETKLNQKPSVVPSEHLQEGLGVLNDELLNTDELLNNVSVEQYFNID